VCCQSGTGGQRACDSLQPPQASARDEERLFRYVRMLIVEVYPSQPVIAAMHPQQLTIAEYFGHLVIADCSELQGQVQVFFALHLIAEHPGQLLSVEHRGQLLSVQHQGQLLSAKMHRWTWPHGVVHQQDLHQKKAMQLKACLAFA